jgi:CDP-glucose 4,6-dehydratase
MDSLNQRALLFKYFHGKRVFITGHTGFKGSWLALVLKELGAEVVGYALPPLSTPNNFELMGLEKSILNIYGDIRERETLSQALSSFQPEYVFHLAAQALVKESYQDPVTTIATNILGSAHLLEAIRECEAVRSLVYITSDKCYENVEWVWGYRENDPLGGHDPYSASKAAAEIIFSAYARSYFDSRPTLGAASARAGNVIGGGDWAANRIVPDCIRAIAQEQTIKLRNPTATRPWQHVLDPISGYLLLALKLYEDPMKYKGSWNFGPTTHETRTVYDVARALIGYIGRGTLELAAAEHSQHEANLLQLNCDKAHQCLGWLPKWRIDKTLEETAKWYQVALNNGNVLSITQKQIRDYFEVA